MGMVIVASGVIFAGIFSAVVLMLAGGTVLVKKYCNGEDKTRHKAVKIVFTGGAVIIAAIVGFVFGVTFALNAFNGGGV